MRKNYKVILVLLLLFLSLRIAIVVIAGQKDINHGDAPSYNGYAIAILQNEDWMTNRNFYGEIRLQ
jgi:hypothetical protein